MQVVNTPMLPTKFLCLKHLTICLRSGHSPYDYFSLVSFLEASPSLETLSLDVRCFQFYPAKMTIRSVGSNNYAFFCLYRCGRNLWTTKLFLDIPHIWGRWLKISIAISRMWRSWGLALRRAWLSWPVISSRTQYHSSVLHWTPIMVVLAGVLTANLDGAAPLATV